MLSSLFPAFFRDSTKAPALVSFDVFDTLLMRRLDTPAAVFEETGRRARARGLIDAGLTPPLFRLSRQEAERRARRAMHRAQGMEEVDLVTIHRCSAVGDAAALAALEVEVEADTLFANPLLLDAVRELAARGCPPVLLSDTYFPPPVLRALLRGAGITEDLYGALYASCAHGCSKRDGGLFRILLADHPGLPPDRILHVGDDPVGDVAMAQAAGLQAAHYAVPPRYGAIRERERAVAGLSVPSPPSRRVVALAGLADDPEASFWLDFGALVLGPAVVEYCRWVVEDCHRRGIGLIAPLMREATLFAPLMEDWIRRHGYGMRVEPLFVSRQALEPLSLVDIDAARARPILTDRSHLAWNELLAQVGAAPPVKLAGIVGMTLDQLVKHRLEDGQPALDAVLALFDSPAVREAAGRRAAEVRTLAVDYFADRLGGPVTTAVTLVDLGARGSTPAAIASLLPASSSPVHVHLCYAVPDLAGPVTEGLAVSVFCAESETAMTLGRILYRTPQILERALTGRSGTTIGYRRDERGHVVPVTAPAPARGDEARALDWLQEGIQRYAALVSGSCAAGADALFPLAAALLMPTNEEARLLGALRYDFNAGTDLERGICDAAAEDRVRALITTGEGPLMGMALGLRPSTAPWPQGALTRLDDGVFRRHADALGLEMGHGVVCRALVARIRREGLRRIAVVAVGGDGGMGPDFIRAAAEAGIELAAYADLMPHLAAGAFFHGVPVRPLESLVELAPLPLVLVTLGYADSLAALARRHFAAARRPLRLVTLGRPDLDVEIEESLSGSPDAPVPS